MALARVTNRGIPTPGKRTTWLGAAGAPGVDGMTATTGTACARAICAITVRPTSRLAALARLGDRRTSRTKKDGRKAAFFRFHVEPLRRRASKRRACSSLSVFLGRDLASPRSDGATNPRQRERGGISGAPPLWTAVSAGQLNRPFTITVHDIAGSHPQGL